MRKITAALSAACLVGVGLIASAGAANATTWAGDDDHEGRVIVAWDLPLDGPSWPQTLAVAQDLTGPVDENTLALLDDELAALPGCSWYQVDIYDDTEALDALLANGTLGGSDSPPEPGVVTWKYAQAVGTGCIPDEPPCVLYKTAVFEMPGFDPVVGKTFPQTLVSVSAATCTPTFPPPPDCKNTQQDIFRADGPLWALALEDGILTEAEGNNPALWAEMYEGGSANSWRLYPATNCVTGVQFDVPVTAPTCESGAMFDAVFPIVREHYTITVDRAYDGPGVYTLTATITTPGYTFEGGGTVRTLEVTLAGKIVSEECTPDIGGKTIGFWTNKNGTAAEKAGGLWAKVVAEYPVQTSGLATFGAAQTFIKNATSSGDGSAMLRAQFFATALNVLYIEGYGAQHITVPATSAIDGGQTVTIVQFLNDIEAGWASLDTKAEITSVQEVLNAINQDAPALIIV